MKKIADLSLQEVFDKVSTHLLSQNKQAIDASFHCQYKIKIDNEVLMCAIGCCIPEKEYNPNLEGKTLWNSKDVRAILGLKMAPSEMEDMLSYLQSIHDSFLPKSWPKQLQKLEKRYNLVFQNK